MMPKRSNAWYGCRRDVRDARDVPFRPRAMRLPAAVDLRAHCAPVMDQGELGACTAHAITGALRFMMLKAGAPDVELSRLQLYYDERLLEGTTKEDAGAEIRNGIKSANRNGIAHEAIWPYAIERFAEAPPDSCYDDGVFQRALGYARVPVSSSGLKTALASGLPVVIGVSLYASFDSDQVAATGVVPMPDLEHEDLDGGHAILCVGYEKGHFIVRNSWAADWGDQGDCYFPEAYLGSTQFGSDYWVIKQI